MRFTPIIEEWRRIPSYGHYDVSDLGRIRRAHDAPKMGRGVPGRLLSTRPQHQGYRTIRMCDGVGARQRTRLVHHLVAEAFLGPRPSGMEVNHKDGIKANNDYRNLEYVTHSNNVYHALHTGLAIPKRGLLSSKSKLDATQLRIIRRSLPLGVTLALLGNLFGVSYQTIANIKTGRTYAVHS